MIGLVTDSNAQLPDALAEELGIAVVPLVVSIDGRSHLEGVDLDVDDFYESLAAGAEIATSQPSPGEIAGVYRRLVEAGAEEIVSVHVAEAFSGTLNSARLAAAAVEVPVHLVDSGHMSFSLGCCAWSAAEARESGSTAEEMVARIRDVSAVVRNAFVMESVARARVGGRVPDRVLNGIEARPGVPVLEMAGSDLTVLGEARSEDSAVDMMIGALESSLAADPRHEVNVGVGGGSAATFGLTDLLTRRVEATEGVARVVRYRCGPTVGAFSGPGVAGLVWYPR